MLRSVAAAQLRDTGVGHVTSGNRVKDARLLLREFLTDVGHDDFALEAANIALSLWARVPPSVRPNVWPNVRPAADHEALIERIALRLCTREAVGQVLCAAVRRADEAVAMIRRCQAQLLTTTGKAMEHRLRANPPWPCSRCSRKAKEPSTRSCWKWPPCWHAHAQPRVPDAEALAARAGALVRRTVQSGGHIAGIQRSGRSPGGLHLRGDPPPQPVLPAVTALPVETAAQLASDATA